jgi:hypothetical protein
MFLSHNLYQFLNIRFDGKTDAMYIKHQYYFVIFAHILPYNKLTAINPGIKIVKLML